MTSLGRGRKKELDDMLDELDSLSFVGLLGRISVSRLQGIIDTAIGFPEPEGDPAHISGKSADYAKAAGYVGMVHGDIVSVAEAGLPAVWIGEAGSKASQVTKAAGRHAELMGEKFTTAGKELSLLAEGIAQAQSAHGRGLDAAHAAKNILGDNPVALDPELAKPAQTAARDALTNMRTAVDRAEAAGERAARELDKLESEARAGKLDSEHLTDADRIALADVAAPGGDREDNEILSAGDLERSGEFLDELSAEDRAAYDNLLDDAKSPQERAYLIKALAAGYDLEEIQGFSEKIHPYGDDPAWLREHLTPVVNSSSDSMKYGDQSETVTFGSEQWKQTGPTCVATSTITGRAIVDPLYALELTTGGHPGDPEYDNPDAFAERFLDEQQRVYAERDNTDQDGMTGSDAEDVGTDEIGAHTGDTYENVPLESDADRRDALPEIRDAVNEGKPVGVGVSGEGGHMMMIIGQEGDKLQIYNPWGFTTWVSEDDFVTGNLEGASDSRLPNAHAVRLPRD